MAAPLRHHQRGPRVFLDFFQRQLAQERVVGRADKEQRRPSDVRDGLARRRVGVVGPPVSVAVGARRGGVVDVVDQVGGREGAAVDGGVGGGGGLFFCGGGVFVALAAAARVFLDFPSSLLLLFSSSSSGRKDLRAVGPHVVLEPDREARVVYPADCFLF